MKSSSKYALKLESNVGIDLGQYNVRFERGNVGAAFLCFGLHFAQMISLPIETTRSRHQQQREQRADRSKERRPSKPVRKVHRAAPSSELNAKPGIIFLFYVRYPPHPLVYF